MQYRIHHQYPEEHAALLGGFSALEADAKLRKIEHDDTLRFYIGAAAKQENIPIEKLILWQQNRDQITEIARAEYMSQFIPLSVGIQQVQNDHEMRFRDVLNFSFGRNNRHTCLSQEQIALELAVHPTTICNRYTQAVLQLLEHLGIFDPSDPVNVFYSQKHNAFRNKPSKRIPVRDVTDNDKQRVQETLVQLQKHHDLKDPLETIQQRWLDEQSDDTTLSSIAAAKNVQELSVHRWELNGVHALHQHWFLMNLDIPRSVRLWAGSVYYLLHLKPGNTKRLLARLLDSPNIWALPSVLVQIDASSRSLFETCIGMSDGIIPTHDSVAATQKETPQEIGKQCATVIQHIAHLLHVPRYEIDWINKVDANLASRKPSPLAEILTPDELQQLESALSGIEQDEDFAHRVLAFRLRFGLNSDGVVYAVNEAAKHSGISNKGMKKSLDSLVKKMEAAVGQLSS